jgi:hypothetical protein
MRNSAIKVCFALTMFREELSTRVLCLFAMLLFSRYFHAALDKRVEAIEAEEAGSHEASPPPPKYLTWGRHTCHVLLLVLLMAMNVHCLSAFTVLLSEQGPSVLLLFAAEYCQLCLELLRVGFKYIMIFAALRLGAAGGGELWLVRDVYNKWGQLLLDIVFLSVTIVYFYLIASHYGMPIIMMRDLIEAARAVYDEFRALRSALTFRKQIHKLPPPSEEDIIKGNINAGLDGPDAAAAAAAAAMGGGGGEEGAVGGGGNGLAAPAAQEPLPPAVQCLICHSEIGLDKKERELAKRLPCSHIYHTACILRWWLKPHQYDCECPTCKQKTFVLLAEQEQREKNAARAAAILAAALQQQEPQQQQQQNPFAEAVAAAAAAAATAGNGAGGVANPANLTGNSGLGVALGGGAAGLPRFHKALGPKPGAAAPQSAVAGGGASGASWVRLSGAHSPNSDLDGVGTGSSSSEEEEEEGEEVWGGRGGRVGGGGIVLGRWEDAGPRQHSGGRLREAKLSPKLREKAAKAHSPRRGGSDPRPTSFSLSSAAAAAATVASLSSSGGAGTSSGGGGAPSPPAHSQALAALLERLLSPPPAPAPPAAAVALATPPSGSAAPSPASHFSLQHQHQHQHQHHLQHPHHPHPPLHHLGASSRSPLPAALVPLPESFSSSPTSPTSSATASAALALQAAPSPWQQPGAPSTSLELAQALVHSAAQSHAASAALHSAHHTLLCVVQQLLTQGGGAGAGAGAAAAGGGGGGGGGATSGDDSGKAAAAVAAVDAAARSCVANAALMGGVFGHLGHGSAGGGEASAAASAAAASPPYRILQSTPPLAAGFSSSSSSSPPSSAAAPALHPPAALDAAQAAAVAADLRELSLLEELTASTRESMKANEALIAMEAERSRGQGLPLEGAAPEAPAPTSYSSSSSHYGAPAAEGCSSDQASTNSSGSLTASSPPTPPAQAEPAVPAEPAAAEPAAALPVGLQEDTPPAPVQADGGGSGGGGGPPSMHSAHPASASVSSSDSS